MGGDTRSGAVCTSEPCRRILARAPRPSPVPPDPPRASRPVIARFVHHVWMMDVTEVRSFLGLRVFHVSGVFDACSRVPLALQVCEARRPAALRLCRQHPRHRPPRTLLANPEGDGESRPPPPADHPGPGAKARGRTRALHPPTGRRIGPFASARATGRRTRRLAPLGRLPRSPEPPLPVPQEGRLNAGSPLARSPTPIAGLPWGRCWGILDTTGDARSWALVSQAGREARRLRCPRRCQASGCRCLAR